MKTKMLAVLLAVAVVAACIPACFAQTQVSELWEEYLEKEFQDYFYRNGDDLSGAEKHALHQLSILEKIQTITPDDWLVWNEKAYHEDTLCLVYEIQGKTVSSPDYRSHSEQLKSATQKKEALFADVSIEDIGKVNESEMFKGYRYMAFAENTEEKSLLLQAYNHAEQLFGEHPYRIVALLQKAYCYFEASQAAFSGAVSQVYGSDDRYRALYQDEEVLAMCEDIIMGIDEMTLEICDGARDGFIQGQTEANAVLAYAAYFRQDENALRDHLHKAKEIAAKSDISWETKLACEFYAAHINFICCFMTEDDMEAAIEEMGTALTNWQMSGSIYYDPSAIDALIDDANEILDIWYNS